jgi:hypothetical protein
MHLPTRYGYAYAYFCRVTENLVDSLALASLNDFCRRQCGFRLRFGQPAYRLVKPGFGYETPVFPTGERISKLIP